MSFTAIDLGASSSRFVSDSGKISVAPNNIVALPDGQTSRITPDSTDIESCLEVQIVKNSGEACEHFPVNFMAGLIAERYSTLQDRPSVQTKKYTQRINYLSAIMCAAINYIKGETSENVWLYLAVPPVEIHEAREWFNKQLVGQYTVTFPKYMGGTQVTINVVGVKCYEESFMAATSFFFNMNGIPKEQNKKYLRGQVLSIDIGASTTDLAIIKNGTYLDKSGKTYRVGGNEARDYLRDAIMSKFDIDLDVESAERCMAEGRLQMGNKFVDISDLVSCAKIALAKKLIAHMQTYFKMMNIDLTTINAIIVSGGGSMQSQYINDDGEVVKTSEPMSYYVTSELQSISEGTDVVPYGDEARFANVKGLFIRAKVDSAHNQMSATPAPQPVVQPVQATTHQPVQAQAPVEPVVQATPAPAPVAEQTTAEAPKAEAVMPTVNANNVITPNIVM